MNFYEVIIRLILAIIIGGAIGYEREFKNRPAGFRTHILVCMGAAVISMIQVYSVEETINMISKNPELSAALKADIGRMGAQVVSGIGFLGAGTIIHEKGSIKGLTTAASLWVVGCIGLGIGLGYYYLSILSGISAVIVLVSLKKFESKLFDKNNIVKIEVEYSNKADMVKKVTEYFEGKSIKIKNIEFELEDIEEGENPDGYNKSLYTLLVPRYIKGNQIIKDLCKNEEVKGVKLV